MASKKLRVIPIGGVGEIGRNLMALEYGANIILIDTGLMFPEHDMLGVDLVIPDFSYLVERSDIVRGIIITHGHEDHIGGLPYLLPKVNAPLYATRLTRGLIEVKLEEYDLLKDTEIHTIDPEEDRLKLGPFRAEFFRVSHSIPDAVGVAIETPVGLVVHTGEYKFDYTPVDGRFTDFQKLAELGQRGVLLLMGDSTNADKQGHTPSEQKVTDAFDDLFGEAEGRIIISTFASNISRVQQIIDVAEKHGRRVGVMGRSLVDSVGMAQSLGYLEVPSGGPLKPHELADLPPEQVVIACTGTQGEPASALVRMSNDEHRHVRIQEGDTVILSATPIPGNEELVHRTLNNLFRLGAQVYYHRLAPVHVSGHASRDELKLMLTLTRPKFFLPIQGEYRHLHLHGELAEEVGIPEENIFIIENGQVVEFDEHSGQLAEKVPGGHVFVDGLGVGDVGNIVLRDRHLLSQDGFVVPIVTVDEHTGELLADPEIISRGFVYMRESEELLEDTKKQVIQAIQRREHLTGAHGVIKDSLSNFLYQRTKRRPMILPVVMEV